MRVHPQSYIVALWGMLLPGWMAGQSSLLSALEGSTPAPVLEPTATALTRGIAGLWSDPTADPQATGLFFGMSHASYASARVFHGAIGFHLGPRWSLAVASADLGNLFDTLLTNQDPALLDLRARALMGALDATISRKHASVSLGFARAADEMIGDTRSSTLMRIHARFLPFGTDELTVGVHWSGAAGGSIAPARGGRKQADVVLTRRAGPFRLATSVAYYQGAQWRFSETVRGYAVSARFEAFSVVHFDLGASRHRVAYGAESYASQRAVGFGLEMGNLTFDMRYSNTALGFGTGYGISFGYEP